MVIWNRIYVHGSQLHPLNHQPQLLSAQSRVRCKVIHTHALVGAARNQPAGRAGSQAVSSSEVVSVTNLRVLSAGPTSRCLCRCRCRHLLSLLTPPANGWSFAEHHPASGSARDEFLCSLDPVPSRISHAEATKVSRVSACSPTTRATHDRHVLACREVVVVPPTNRSERARTSLAWRSWANGAGIGRRPKKGPFMRLDRPIGVAETLGRFPISA